MKIRHDLDLPIVIRAWKTGKRNLLSRLVVRVVPAQVVDVAPHLAMVASFAVHARDNSALAYVSNIETGYQVAIGRGVPDAIDMARSIFSSVSVRKMRADMKAAHAQSGRLKP